MIRRSAELCAVIVGAFLIGGLPRTAFAASAFSESKRVQVSTTAASPTLISNRGNYQRTLLINRTTYYCLFGDNDDTFSTSTSTGTARITNESFTPDGPREPYQGAIYGVCEAPGPVYVDCIRIK